MKKILALVLSLALITVFFAGCKPSENPKSSKTPTQSVQPVTPTPISTPKPPFCKDNVLASETAFGSVVRAMKELSVPYDPKDAMLVWKTIFFAASYMQTSKTMISAFPGDNITISESEILFLYSLCFKNATDIPEMPTGFTDIVFNKTDKTYTMAFLSPMKNKVEIGEIKENADSCFFNLKLLSDDKAILSNYIVTLVLNTNPKTIEWCPLVVAGVEAAK
ncbi:MAG: hypothetical protein RR398_04700 [Clostridia bacterium]